MSRSTRALLAFLSLAVIALALFLLLKEDPPWPEARSVPQAAEPPLEDAEPSFDLRQSDALRQKAAPPGAGPEPAGDSFVVRGRVTDAAGGGIAGAEVALRWMARGRWPPEGGEAAAVTGALGAYEVEASDVYAGRTSTERLRIEWRIASARAAGYRRGPGGALRRQLHRPGVASPILRPQGASRVDGRAVGRWH